MDDGMGGGMDGFGNDSDNGIGGNDGPSGSTGTGPGTGPGSGAAPGQDGWGESTGTGPGSGAAPGQDGWGTSGIGNGQSTGIDNDTENSYGYDAGVAADNQDAENNNAVNGPFGGSQDGYGLGDIGYVDPQNTFEANPDVTPMSPGWGMDPFGSIGIQGYDTTSDNAVHQAVAPVMNKVGTTLVGPVGRAMTGMAGSTIGAALGAPFGPVGSVIGGLLGGKAGSSFANETGLPGNSGGVLGSAISGAAGFFGGAPASIATSAGMNAIAGNVGPQGSTFGTDNGLAGSDGPQDQPSLALAKGTAPAAPATPSFAQSTSAGISPFGAPGTNSNNFFG